MPARLIYLDASQHSFVVTCACGHRAARATREAAHAEADRHRRAAHPRQAQYADSKRRSRDMRPA